MKLFARTSIAFLLAAFLACGNGVFIFGFSTGTISNDPFCDPGGGHFNLRDQGGLIIIVIIDDDTTIVLSSGSTGTCADLFAGNEVDVRGSGEDDTITAREIVVK